MKIPHQSPSEFIAALARAGTRRTTPAGQGEVVWHVWGQGYPLVLLHGGTGSWMHWVRNIEDLSQDFMLLVPDIPGSGESANPEAPPTADRIAAALLTGIDAILGPDAHFAIAGFSMGGLVASHVVHHAPTRADCLVLVGGTGMNLWRDAMEPLVSWRRLATEEGKQAAHRRNLEILMIHDPRNIDELAVHIQSVNATQSRVRGKHFASTGAFARCLQDFPGRLAGIWGEHDATAAPHLAERKDMLQQIQPAATFDIFPGVGHWVQYEASEDFNRRLREVLRSGM
jgi:pimeloyl-ACP methyl ester carboxylesterase